ncbi:arginase family protein [Streptomyces sp. NPDC059499]|uniref:arginase family protein n=1 Tax=Streptomyces sp. NPDC059499 TaxID=3346852 RepID=UPI0036A689BB
MPCMRVAGGQVSGLALVCWVRCSAAGGGGQGVGAAFGGGLTWAELESVLRTALSGDRAVGLDITIFNPRLDPDGTIAARLTECLHRGLSARTGIRLCAARRVPARGGGWHLPARR